MPGRIGVGAADRRGEPRPVRDLLGAPANPLGFLANEGLSVPIAR